MIERRKLIGGAVSTFLTGLFGANASAEATAKVPKDFEDAGAFVPPVLLERLQSCMADAFAAMDRSGKKSIIYFDGSVTCHITEYGTLMIHAGGKVDHVYISMPPDEPAYITNTRENLTRVITNLPAGQLLQQGLREKLEQRNKAGMAPGWYP